MQPKQKLLFTLALGLAPWLLAPPASAAVTNLKIVEPVSGATVTPSQGLAVKATFDTTINERAGRTVARIDGVAQELELTCTEKSVTDTTRSYECSGNFLAEALQALTPGAHTVTVVARSVDGSTGNPVSEVAATAPITVATSGGGTPPPATPAAAALDALIAKVNGLAPSNPPGIVRGEVQSLLSKLLAAKASLQRGQPKTAANQLNAFMNHVRAQRGKRLTVAAADHLLADARILIGLLLAPTPPPTIPPTTPPAPIPPAPTPPTGGKPSKPGKPAKPTKPVKPPKPGKR